MAGCGYVCPLCEGKGFDNEGKKCGYCTSPSSGEKDQQDEWLKSVHEGPCCGDLGVQDPKE